VKIDHCIFPEGIFYDTENFVWANLNNDKTVTIGITAILASIAGRLSTIKLKEIGTELEKGKSVGTIESIKYFGVVRTPVRGSIAEINKDIINQPKLVNDFPYTEGWIMKINPSNLSKDLIALDTIKNYT
jgi:glycine cleavage system H protein